jgi:ribosomal protein S18 acetylase RimI-like enzyme
VTEHHLGAKQLRGGVAEVLAAAFAEAPYNRAPGEVDGMLQRFDRHARKPGFRLVLAVDDGRPVALAYGYTLPADTGWWKDTLEPVPAEVAREDGSRSFAVFELAVVPDRRREHLASRVHTALLADRPEQRAVLNVRQDAGPAQAAYAAWGYRPAASVVPWDGAPVYDVMVRNMAEVRAR